MNIEMRYLSGGFYPCDKSLTGKFINSAFENPNVQDLSVAELNLLCSDVGMSVPSANYYKNVFSIAYRIKSRLDGDRRPSCTDSVNSRVLDLVIDCKDVTMLSKKDIIGYASAAGASSVSAPLYVRKYFLAIYVYIKLRDLSIKEAQS